MAKLPGEVKGGVNRKELLALKDKFRIGAKVICTTHVNNSNTKESEGVIVGIYKYHAVAKLNKGWCESFTYENIRNI